MEISGRAPNIPRKHPNCEPHAPPHRLVAGSLQREVVGIKALDVIGAHKGNADPMVDHKFGELGPPFTKTIVL
jgi:hypothetical protein